MARVPRPPRLTVRANQRPDQQGRSPSQAASPHDVFKTVDAVLRRYDFVSAGLGALAVTAVCVAHGQDPWTALQITAASTVVALLANDMLCNGDE